ncbi:hypothetical protein D3C84_855480 [compost metagenome]
MPLIHAAGAADHRRNTGLIEQPAFGAERDRAEVIAAAQLRNQTGRRAVDRCCQPGIGGDFFKANRGVRFYRLHRWQQGLLGIGLQLSGDHFRRKVRQGAHFEIKAAVFRHDIQRRPTANHAYLHRRIRRVEAVVVMLWLRQARADFTQPTDQPCSLLDGVHSIRRVGRMARRTVDVATHCQLAFMA